MKELKKFHRLKKQEIKERLKDFSKVNKNSKKDLFYELCFCIMAVQTSGLRSGNVAEKLKKEKFYDRNIKPTKFLREGYIRFHNNKTNHLLKAKKEFGTIYNKLKNEKDLNNLREWLVKNVKGIGMKEASHYLRNIGLGKNQAILDRHILKNMAKYNFIKEMPKTITTKNYLELEKDFLNMSKKLKISPAELDLLLWAKEVGVVFK